MTFNEAFAKARKEKGAGKTFTWNGKEYTTDYATEKKKDGPKRPKARPTAPATSKRPPRTKSNSGSKVTVKPLPSKKDSTDEKAARTNSNEKSKPKKDSTTNRPGKMPVDTRKKPVTGRTKSPVVERIKSFSDYMDENYRPKVRELLGIGADMPPQQPTSRGSRNRRKK